MPTTKAVKIQMSREVKLQQILERINETYITKEDLDLPVEKAYDLILDRIVEDNY